MKITNKNNLPLPLYAAIADSEYSKGDAQYSVTQLIDPPRKVALETLYGDVLETDAADSIPALLGTAIHEKIERSARAKGYTVEQRLYAEIDGVKISGQFDYIDDEGLLWDWKVASVWEIMNGVKDSREQQLNIYGYLASLNDIRVRGLRVGFIFRDWSIQKSLYETGYPQSQTMVYPIPRWDDASTIEFIRQRLGKLQEHKLAECSPDERWASPDRYAVIKDGKSRASRLFTSHVDAINYINGRGDYTVEFRPGESTRCKFYCPVAAYCDQWKELQRG